jgi:hypothetical protein
VPDAGPVFLDEAKRRIEEIVPMTSELDAGLTKGSYAFVTTTGGRAYHGQVENSTQRGFWLVGAAVVYETPLDHKSEPKRMFIAWDAVETVIESPANADDDGEARAASWEDAKRWQRDVRGATLPHNFLGVDVQVNLHSDENRWGQIEEVRSTGVLVEDRRRSHTASSELAGPGRRKVLSFIPWTSIDFIEWERTDLKADNPT